MAASYLMHVGWLYTARSVPLESGSFRVYLSVPHTADKKEKLKAQKKDYRLAHILRTHTLMEDVSHVSDSVFTIPIYPC